MPLSKRDSASLPKPFSVRTSGQFEGNDGSWSTFLLSVGNPAQSFRALVSTSSFSTWLPTPGGCTYEQDPSFVPTNCSELRGVGLSNGFQSSGFQESGTYKYIGINSLELGNDLSMTGAFGSAYNATGDLGLDSVTVQDAAGSAKLSPDANVPVFGMTTWNFFLPSLGIGDGYLQSTTQDTPSFLESLANQSLIPSRSWSYTAGASYRNYLGSLVLGGYDEARIEGNTTTYYALPASKDTRELQLSLSSIAFSFKNGTEASVPVSETVVIDSTLPYLYLPSSVCDQLASRLSLTYDGSTDLFTVGDAALASNRNAIDQVRIAVADTQNSGNTTSITFPYDAFNLNATWPTYDQNQSQPFFPIRRAPGNTYILGRAFLQEAHVSVDFERAYFNLSQASFPASQASSNLVPIYNASVTESGFPSSSSSHLSRGAIAGIVVGAVSGALLLLALVLWVLFSRRRREQEKRHSQHEHILSSPKMSEIIPPLSPAAASSYDRDHISPIDGQFLHITRVNELGVESAHESRMGVNVLPGIHEMEVPPKPVYQADDTPVSGSIYHSSLSNFQSSPSNRGSTARSELEG
ncbi:uncharacterized protein PV09_07517 [Verruconis gallopava]|uniref:Peptidase A1 domain-containing protein n=1 Tax=Verruconis gallopava TaxID=253628 RepID=A0A0D2APG2_9PEZI|nr:uncharacterized protein PV09_07517 [Verruconis gallopava]KIW00999.1 hypothetical protein PV09_07517 [Verruconis gallopava]